MINFITDAEKTGDSELQSYDIMSQNEVENLEKRFQTEQRSITNITDLPYPQR